MKSRVRGSGGDIKIILAILWRGWARIGDTFSGRPFFVSGVTSGAVRIFGADDGAVVARGLDGFRFDGLFGLGRSWLGAVGFTVLFEEAVVALEFALGGGFIAEEEIVLSDLLRGPIVGNAALGEHEEGVEVALGAAAMPFGAGSGKEELVFEGVEIAGVVVDFGNGCGRFVLAGASGVGGFGLVLMEPAIEELLPFFYGFVGKDEGFGTATMLQSILSAAGAAGGRGRTGTAGIAFFGRGGRFWIERHDGLEGGGGFELDERVSCS